MFHWLHSYSIEAPSASASASAAASAAAAAAASAAAAGPAKPPAAATAAAAVAVLVINYAAVGKNYTIDFVKLPSLGSSAAVSVRDVWERKPAGRGRGSFVVELPPYDSALLLLETVAA